MPDVSKIIRIRQQQRTRQQRSPWLKLGLASGVVVSLLMVTLSLIGGRWYIELTRDLPSVETLASLLEPPKRPLFQSTRLYDRTAEHIILTLENPAAANKQYLYVGKSGQAGLDQVSQDLVDATIIELDPQFWHNPGYSLDGIYEGTHPTLAQWLISDLVLGGESPSVKRNIRERLLAAQVTAKYGREKVLEWYLNIAQFGELIYGVDAAARAYYGKSAVDLTLAEAVMLTAIAEFSGSNPSSDFQMLKEKQELIIQKMLVEGYVSGDEARQALKEDVQLRDQTGAQSLAPLFTQLVLMQLSTRMPLERILRGGFEIFTTLDYGLQMQSVCTAEIQLARVHGAKNPIISIDDTPCDSGNLLPTLQTEVDKNLKNLMTEVVVIDPLTGHILAMVGGEGAGISPASQATHPAGSILTPFLYVSAFTRGMSPATLLWDLPVSHAKEMLNPDQIDVNLESLTSYQGPVSLRKVFANDYQGAGAEILAQVGADNLWLTEKQFGISTSELTSGTGSGMDDLYSQPVSLLESVQAYSILANQGVMSGQTAVGSAGGETQNEMSSTTILRVVDGDGKVWIDWTNPEKIPVVSPQIAYLATHIMSDEKARWPSLGHPNALEIGRPAAAKVNLTVETSDAWTVGYTPRLAIGVWMGRSAVEAGEISVDMPAGIWHALMQYASKEMPVQEFATPSGISKLQVCDPSGKLVTPLCQTIAQEVFLAGNEPTQPDDMYQKFYINRETGLLATIFTDSKLVDEKIYLVVPPEAVDWAKAVGLPVPPDSYDDINPATTSSEDVQITNLKMFDHVSGQLSLRGSATGDGFEYYRIQVGKGLYPQEWIQVGEDVHRSVKDGFLGTWDTTELDGTFILELLVVKEDKRIERATVQLTIDNSFPQVQILSPRAGEQFSAQQDPIIIMNASVSDNQAIQRVEYYVDGKLESILYEPPRIILWTAQPGRHVLGVKAYDLAGNAYETTAIFLVHE